MAETSIEWTDRSVNPIRFGAGHFCQKISPGCTNCYASRMQPRFGGVTFKGAGGPIPPAASRLDAASLWLDESKLREVLRRKKPAKWFWCDMTDLFGDWVPDEWIDRCFAAMALTPQHTHQVLTKRPERMRDYFATPSRIAFIHAQQPLLSGRMPCQLPLPNVWLGVSVEDQARADERIPLLLQTPAAVRFLSVEPLLGPVNFMRVVITHKLEQPLQDSWRPEAFKPAPRIDWCIVGGESGPGARPMNVEWARSIVRQCQAAGVACFVKQLGSVPFDNGSQPAGGWWPDQKAYRQDVLDGQHVYYRKLNDRKGGDMAEFPSDLRVREFPAVRLLTDPPACLREARP